LTPLRCQLTRGSCSVRQFAQEQLFERVHIRFPRRNFKTSVT
jgi:hypothetical protein